LCAVAPHTQIVRNTWGGVTMPERFFRDVHSPYAIFVKFFCEIFCRGVFVMSLVENIFAGGNKLI
jgi:hypothetical protein